MMLEGKNSLIIVVRFLEQCGNNCAVSTFLKKSNYALRSNILNMNTIRNVVLSLCIGSIVAIAVNLLINSGYKFSSTALALGFFVFSTVFIIKPIRVKNENE